MRHLNYTLTPSRINNVKGKPRPYKLTDGGGLYVQVMPSGIKTWRFRYVLGGAAGDVRIGRYPEIGVADARDRHFELRQLGVIVSFQQIVTVAAGQAVGSPMRRLGM